MKLSSLKRIILITIILVLSGTLVFARKYLKEKKAESMSKTLEIEDLQSEIDKESAEADEINKTKDNITDEDYEELARKELGLIKKDEIVIKPR